MVSVPCIQDISNPAPMSSTAAILLDQSSSGTDATPAAPVRAAGTLTVDPQTHEDIWYALCLMRPCYPMSDYGLGLALLSQLGISEEQARAVMEVC